MRINCFNKNVGLILFWVLCEYFYGFVEHILIWSRRAIVKVTPLWFIPSRADYIFVSRKLRSFPFILKFLYLPTVTIKFVEYQFILKPSNID